MIPIHILHTIHKAGKGIKKRVKNVRDKEEPCKD